MYLLGCFTYTIKILVERISIFSNPFISFHSIKPIFAEFELSIMPA